MPLLSHIFPSWLRHLVAATIALSLVIALNQACAAQSVRLPSEGERVTYHPSSKVRVVPDVVFARYGGRSLRLDLYLPDNHKQAVPGVIVIRGGGWMVNDRTESAHVASALAERGAAAASIEYRTADEAGFPGAVQDVKAAVRWMRANAAAYGISAESIGTLGGSSGAHMALLAGISKNRDFEGNGGNNNVSSRVQAVVAMATPTDVARLDAGGRRTVARFLHATLAQNPKLWARASPVNYVAASGPPVLLMHSDADEAVLPEQSARFAELYRKAGGSAELVIMRRAPHAFWNYKPWFDESMDRAAAFLIRIASHG
jgi:acetyl esterase/lipase